MTRLSPRLARDSFSPLFFHRHRHLPLRTAAEAGSGLSHLLGERLLKLPVKLQAIAVCRLLKAAELPNLGAFRANLARPLSKGVALSAVDGKRIADSASKLIGLNRGVHSACQSSIECTAGECAVLDSNGSVSSCKTIVKNRNLEQFEEEFSNGTGTGVRGGQFHDGRELKFVPPKIIKLGRRFRRCPDLLEVRLKLDFYSKVANLHGALELFDQVKREQRIQLDTHSYNQLLYLCSGAASGKLLQNLKVKKSLLKEIVQDDEGACKDSKIHVDINSSKVMVHFSSEDTEIAMSRGADIVEAMFQDGVKLDEATYTSIVRLAVAKKDGDLAFNTIKLMELSGIPPKLRSCGPLLLFLCNTKETAKAYEFDDHMLSLDVEPDESMLDHLLNLSIEARQDDKVYSLLHRLRKSIRVPSPETVQSIKKWFSSDHAAFAGKARWENLPSKEEISLAWVSCGEGWHGLGWLGTGAWQVRTTRICKAGSCLKCGERLCAIDLNPKDTEDFALKVAKLAQSSEKSPSQFSIFQNWIDKHGPFDAIIDGANVGLYNPVIYKGFNTSLLQAVVNEMSTRFCFGKPPLVVVHARHKGAVARYLNGRTLSNNGRKHWAVYFTPGGSNDDWYWLYAAVKCKCMLLSNDQMRDHIFSLFGNDFFPNWKERHQVHFSFTAKSLKIYPPPPYSTIIQESESGSWHIPQALPTVDDDIDGCREWLCVTRSGSHALEV